MKHTKKLTKKINQTFFETKKSNILKKEEIKNQFWTNKKAPNQRLYLECPPR
jgi:hypothetical protein